MADKWYAVCKESYGSTYTEVSVYDDYPIYEHNIINQYEVVNGEVFMLDKRQKSWRK